MNRTICAALAMVLMTGCSSATPASQDATPAETSGASGSASATVRPTEAAVAGAKPVPTGGKIEPGRYSVSAGPWTPEDFSFTMPAGWIAENGGQTISKHAAEREIGFSVSVVDRLFADPCGSDQTISVGPTADDLAAALRQLPGAETESATPVTVGGRAGLLVELTVADGVDTTACDPPIGLQIWLDKSESKYFVSQPDTTSRVYGVDVGGGRFVLVAHVGPQTPPADVAQLDAIVDSIGFGP